MAYERCLGKAEYLLTQKNAILQRRSEVLAPKFFLRYCLGEKKKRKKSDTKKTKKKKPITEQSGLDEERRREVRGGWGVICVK